MSFFQFIELDDYIPCVLSQYDNGQLYNSARNKNSNLYKLFKGFLEQHFLFYTETSNIIDGLSIDLNNVDPNNPLLDNYVKEFGLTQYTAFDLSSNIGKANAITLFYHLQNVRTRQEIISLFSSIGYTITIQTYTEYCNSNKYGIGKYGQKKYSTSSYEHTFILYISIQYGQISDINNKYGVGKYGQKKYANPGNLDGIKQLINNIFPCYIIPVFL
jgi:hypothetical protein